MNFRDIRPFVRFSRYMNLDTTVVYPEYIPIDARLFYTLSGIGEIRTKETIHPMKKGSLLLIPPGKRYQLLTPEQNVEYLALNFDMTQEFSHLDIPIHPHPANQENCPEPIGVYHFEHPSCLNEVFYADSMRRIENTLLKLEFEYAGKLLYSETKTSAYLLEILAECVREAERKNSYPDGSNCKINDIILYIQQNYRQDLSNLQLAEVFHFHPNYISNMLKLHTGMSLHRYLLYVRITNAINLLETTNLTVGEIAAEVGFYDSNYFTRYFKQIVGKPPKQFRSGK